MTVVSEQVPKQTASHIHSLTHSLTPSLLYNLFRSEYHKTKGLEAGLTVRVLCKNDLQISKNKIKPSIMGSHIKSSI
jgi:hypothetical protein